MASLGQELKRERELRGISLKEISSSTKINQKFLKALEEDQLEILPGEFFVKGILRSYAAALGLDGDYVLNKYHEEMITLEQTDRLAQRKQKIRTGFQKRFILPLSVGAAVLGLIILSIVVVTRNQKSVPSSVIPKSRTPQIREASPPPPAQPAQKLEIEEFKDLNLDLSFNQKTWIQVYADGTLVLDGLKFTGERANLKAIGEFIIHVGNAGGLNFDLNGQKGKPFGPPGEVIKNIRITLENFRQFLLPETDPQAAPAEKRG